VTSSIERRYRIGSIPGDGIGPETVAVARRVLEVAAENGGFGLEWREFPWGCDHYLQTGSMMDADGIEQLSTCDAILLGAAGRPDVPDHVSLWGRCCCVDGSPGAGEGGGMKRNRRPRPPVPVPSAFAGFRFPPDVILLAVRWYLRYGLSYRTWRSSSPSAASMSITSPCTGGCSGGSVALTDRRRSVRVAG
jgi:hypothetical protein